MTKHRIAVIFLLSFFVLMILYPKTVFLAASEGLLLWFQTVLPTLLPYMILNNLLIHTSALHWICRITAPVFCRIFSTSYYGTFAVISGFLCGYPVGAKTTSDLLEKQHITYDEAGYLLSFCNNTSPVFVISYVVHQNLQDPSLTVPFLLILFLSPVLASFLFRRFYSLHRVETINAHYSHDINNTLSISAKSISDQSPDRSSDLFDVCIMNAFEALTKIGGYMMLFAVAIRLLSECFPENSFTLPLYATLELSTGIRMIAQSSYPDIYKILFSAALTAFGGWCCVMQTYSMTAKDRMPMIPYIAEKLVTAVVTSLLVSAYVYYFYTY